MPTTQLSDIFVSDYYGTLEPVNSPEKTAVFESGIVTRSATLDGIARTARARPKSATGKISTRRGAEHIQRQP